MAIARDFARGKVDVLLFTAQYPEDRPLVPADFQATRDLERSVLDLGHFRKKRKLPFIKDILDRLYQAAPEAEYLIYTNVDIALKPEFYVAVNTFIEEGQDAFVINRRTIRKYQSIEEIPLMYADPGENHPGWDCFVFKRDSYPLFILADICVGANLIGTVLLFNLLCTSKNFMEFKDKHLTFHLGDDMTWKAEDYSDYAAHNILQTEEIISKLKSVYGSVDGGGRYGYLLTFVQNLKSDMTQKKNKMGIKKIEPSNSGGKKLQRGGNPRIICITGMARSGTSMVARILNIMGLYLGPEDNLILHTEYNVEGCWEHKTLLEISNTIIYDLGWHGLQQPEWVNSPTIVSLETAARATIEKDFGDTEFWGWKDDRCSLTLPFWLKILPETESIICVRNPIDVAKSLLKQNWVSSLEEGLYRWLILISSAIRNTQGRRRLIVFFEDFLGEDWKIALKRIAEFLGPSYVEKLPEYEKEAGAFIKRDLHHHKASMKDMLDRADIPYAVKHLYFFLYNHIRGKRFEGFSELDSTDDQVLDSIVSYINTEAFRINQQYLLLVSKSEKIETLGDSLKERDKQIQAKDKQIEALTNSLSWKVTAPLRRVYEILNIDKKGSN